MLFCNSDLARLMEMYNVGTMKSMTTMSTAKEIVNQSKDVLL